MPDDTAVRLVGRIVRALGDEGYEFEDDTGMMVVEIDDDVWKGLEIGPETRVELIGEIDNDGRDVELDVDSVRSAGS